MRLQREVGRMENIIVDIIAGKDKLAPWSLGGSVAAALNLSALSKFVELGQACEYR